MSDDLATAQKLLAAAERDLDREEAAARERPAEPEVLLALATERERLAKEWDEIAHAFDGLASGRDGRALHRDQAASVRDQLARARGGDTDEAWRDRFHAGVDRDNAAGDRADAHDDRGSAAGARSRASRDRGRAADDLDQARAGEDTLRAEIAKLQDLVTEARLVGQATGVLMERYNLPAPAAYATLVQLAQQADLPLLRLSLHVTDQAEVTLVPGTPT